GLRGVRISSSGTQAVLPMTFIHHVIQSNGVLYQLVIWGASMRRDLVESEGRQLAAGFHVLDPNRGHLGESDRAEPIFASSKFGYRVDLSNTVWSRRWKDMAATHPSFEFGVTTAAANAYFGVLPVWIGDDNLDSDILIHSLASRVGVP